MKKNLFYYVFAVLCTVTLFTSCSDDNGGDTPNPVNPLVGTYGLADYTTENVTIPSEGEGEKDKVIDNYPVTSSLYADYVINGGDNDASNATFMVGLLRMMGGAMLPQVLSSVELKEDGNVVASYVENPVIQGTDKLMGWGWAALSGKYPAGTDITALAATSGFVTSPTGLAMWSENNGKVMVKLNITNILSVALGGQDASEWEETINQILNAEPAFLKQLLGEILGIDLTKVSDATIKQLQGWALNGIPMNKKEENGRLYLYLDKFAFDSLLKPHEDGQTSDLSLIYGALYQAGIIPSEASAAIFMIAGITTQWSKTETFNIGLDLIKK